MSNVEKQIKKAAEEGRKKLQRKRERTVKKIHEWMEEAKKGKQINVC